MSTITKEFTKEQLIAAACSRIYFARQMLRENPLPLAKRKWEIELSLSEIALASLEAEPGLNHQPVAWQYKEYVYVSGLGYLWREKLECEFPGSECETLKDVVPLYTAPPASVSVPTFEEWCERTEQKPVGWVRDAMKEAYDACRAAMLQGAEPVTTTTGYKLRDAVDAIRNSGIAIDAEKILAERDALNAPDCWCHTCRPVTISDMRFVVCPDCGNKRCPHANYHRNACTGSNEPGQEGSAYPAAPQQE
ncbi:hypothetical protein AB1D33_002210 [Enterobacter hormaechei]